MSETNGFIKKLVNLDSSSIAVVEANAEYNKLGSRGFSASLRMIIQEWARDQQEVEAQLERDFGGEGIS